MKPEQLQAELQNALQRINHLEAVVQLLNSRSLNSQVSFMTLLGIAVGTGYANGTYTVKATITNGKVTAITLV